METKYISLHKFAVDFFFFMQFAMLRESKFAKLSTQWISEIIRGIV